MTMIIFTNIYRLTGSLALMHLHLVQSPLWSTVCFLYLNNKCCQPYLTQKFWYYLKLAGSTRFGLPLAPSWNLAKGLFSWLCPGSSSSSSTIPTFSWMCPGSSSSTIPMLKSAIMAEWTVHRRSKNSYVLFWLLRYIYSSYFRIFHISYFIFHITEYSMFDRLENKLRG